MSTQQVSTLNTPPPAPKGNEGTESNDKDRAIIAMLTELLAKISEKDSENQTAQADFMSQLGGVIKDVGAKMDKKADDLAKQQKRVQMAFRVATVCAVICTAGAAAAAMGSATVLSQAALTAAQGVGAAATFGGGVGQILLAGDQRDISNLKAEVDSNTTSLSRTSSDLGRKAKTSNQIQSNGTEAQAKFMGTDNRSLRS